MKPGSDTVSEGAKTVLTGETMALEVKFSFMCVDIAAKEAIETGWPSGGKNMGSFRRLSGGKV